MKIEDIIKLIPKSDYLLRYEWFFDNYGLVVGNWFEAASVYTFTCLSCKTEGRNSLIRCRSPAVAIKHATTHKQFRHKLKRNQR